MESNSKICEEKEDYPKHSYILQKSGLHNECSWAKGKGINHSPHVHEIRKQKLICDDISDAIGYTPIVRINNITKKEGVECEILAKCEFMNPGGSCKDRMARRMLLDAEKAAKIK